jgi:hypothetical protein
VPSSHGLSVLRGCSHPSTPPCGKSKDYAAVNLYDDIAPGSVSFHQPLESDLGEYGGFSILECVIDAFDESEGVRHDSSVASWRARKCSVRLIIRVARISGDLVAKRLPVDQEIYPGDDERGSNGRLAAHDDKPQRSNRRKNAPS